MLLQHRIGIITWRLLPALTVFALMLVVAMPKYGLTLQRIMPLLPLLAISYWSLYRPQMFGAPTIFVLGLLYDGMTGSPMGWHALWWLAARMLLRHARQQIREEGFVVAWIAVALLTFVLLSLEWLIRISMDHAVYSLFPLLMQWALTVALYPGIHATLHALERGIHRRYWFVLKAG